MNTRTGRCAGLAGLLLAAAAARGGDGRLEISQSMLPYTINAPGSYVATENLHGTNGASGIIVATNGVTIDLNGFELAGAAGSLDGVAALSGRHTIAVQNGFVRGWGDDGVDLRNASNCAVRGITASTNSDCGIRLGTGGRLDDCTAYANAGNGIEAGEACLIRGCVLRENGGHGLQATNGCIISHVVARQNGNDGLRAGDGCTLDHCNARDNGDDGIVAGRGSHVDESVGYNNDTGLRMTGPGGNIVHCSLYGNSLQGIDADAAAAVIQCTVSESALAGIRAASNSFLYGNLAYLNGAATTNAGLAVTGRANRVEMNHVVGSPYGFSATAPSNLFVCNSAAQSGLAAYSLATNSLAGATTNNPAGAGPWANFGY